MNPFQIFILSHISRPFAIASRQTRGAVRAALAPFFEVCLLSRYRNAHAAAGLQLPRLSGTESFEHLL